MLGPGPQVGSGGDATCPPKLGKRLHPSATPGQVHAVASLSFTEASRVWSRGWEEIRASSRIFPPEGGG